MSVSSTLPPQILPDDTARARRQDPVTSHEAADRTDAAGSRRHVMLMALTHGPMTDHMLVSFSRQIKAAWSESRLRTARHELMQPEHGSLLEWTEARGPSATRKHGAQIWRVAI